MTDLLSANPDPAAEAPATPQKTRRTRTPKAAAPAATASANDNAASPASGTPEAPAKPRRTRKTAPKATEQAAEQGAAAPAAPKPRRSRTAKTATPAEAPANAPAETPKISPAVTPVATEAATPAADAPAKPRRTRSSKKSATPATESRPEAATTQGSRPHSEAAPRAVIDDDARDADETAGADDSRPSRSSRRRSRKSRNKNRRPAEGQAEQDLVVKVPGMGLFAPASMVALVSNPLHLPSVATPVAPAVRASQPPMKMETETSFASATAGRPDGASLPYAPDAPDAPYSPDAENDDADIAADGEAAAGPTKRRRSRRGGRGRKKNNGAPQEGGDIQPTDAQPAETQPRQGREGRGGAAAQVASASTSTFFGNADEDESDEAPVEGIGGTVLLAGEGDSGAEGSRKGSRSRSRRRASAARKAVVAVAEVTRKGGEPETEKARGRRMLISVQPDAQVEVLLTEDGVVQEYYIEMVHQAKIRGNIYKGVINNIDTNLQAAFVNFGQAKNGFLQIDEIHPEYWLTHHEPVKGQKYPPIQKVMKVGQEVLVQVVKEPTGNKGAFLTTWVSLAGRFLVLTPGQEQIGISRKVEDGEERNRLRELIKGIETGPGLGAIVRTVSAGTSKTTLQKDLNFLKRVWKDIRKRGTVEKAPCLIYQEPGLATRAVRDYLSDDVAEIWVDDAATATAINDMASLLFPRKSGEADLVQLYADAGQTLWEHFGIQPQLEEVHAREVILPSGGRLVFDQTEALMAIDINSGKTSGKTNFASMAHRTNTEAAEAIARQLRLRDIGGQIVIDFIEMRDPKHCHEVEKVLRNAMKADRARHDVARMSSFGLLEIVRQRTGSSAISITQEPCPHCNGTGMRRNMEWQSLQILRELRRQMRQAATAGQTEFLHESQPEVGVYLLNNKRAHLAALEKEFGIRLEIRIVGI